MDWILLFLFAYVLGSLPFGVIVARLACGKDPRQEGSQNPGATNVARICGTGWGVLVLALDILKGWLPVFIALQKQGGWLLVSIAALAAVYGHVYSCFLSFKGGKAVATTIGAFLAITFWGTVFSAAACIAVILASGYVSLGSLTLAVALPVFALLTGNVSYIPLGVALTFLLFWRHRENIDRLRNGTEKTWRKKTEEAEEEDEE